jgi:hypothetical protein
MRNPVKLADGMRCKGYDIRAYSEEQEIILQIVFQDFFEAIKVFQNGIDQSLFRVRCEPKCMAGCAAQTECYSWIANLHDF